MNTLDKSKLGSNSYTLIFNYVLHDINISIEAKGLYCIMVSRPDDWTFYMTELQTLSKNLSKQKLRSAMKELIDCGLIFREKLRSTKVKSIRNKILKVGSWEYIYHILDYPKEKIVQGSI